MKSFTILFFLFFSFSCTVQRNATFQKLPRLQFIGKFELPHNLEFQQTNIGGLSGIDYDPQKDLYYLISDDRSDIQPSRYYTAKIFLNETGIDSVRFLQVQFLHRPDGTVFPSGKKDPTGAADPESIRYLPQTKQLVWSGEGERVSKKDTTVLNYPGTFLVKDTILLQQPGIFLISEEGNLQDSFSLPHNLLLQTTQLGPRRNGVFEGLSFANNYKTLFVSTEEPLYEDGPRAGLIDSFAWTRLTKFDVKSKKPLAQFAIRIEPVPYKPDPEGGFRVNGISEILALDENRLLVVERSFSIGRKPSAIRVFLVDLNGATDISSVPSLIISKNLKSSSKSLVLNMDNLGIYTDNIEGITLGPKLKDGRQTVIFISDNNFSKDQITQFLLFTLE